MRSSTVLTAAIVALLAAACDPAAITPAPAPGPGGAAPDAATAQADLATLRVAPEDTGAHYDRDDWPHWDTKSGRCDTRETALQQQGTGVQVDRECHATAGSWTSPYDGVQTTSSRSLDIDHLVPLAEAARSGTRGWTRQQRETFANDLNQLLVVSLKSNRSKGDQDPAKWMPPADGYRCTYVARWVAVKKQYGMTVDQAEHDALASILRRCGGR